MSNDIDTTNGSSKIRIGFAKGSAKKLLVTWWE